MSADQRPVLRGRRHARRFDPAGNVVAGGYHESGDLAIATVVKLAPDGAVVWRTDVDPLGSRIDSVYADPAGDVLVQGFAGGTDEDSYGHPTVVKLDGATGVERWRHVGLDEDVASLVVDAAGNASSASSARSSGDARRTERSASSPAWTGPALGEPDCGGSAPTPRATYSRPRSTSTLTATIHKISGADGRIWTARPA